MVRTGVAMHRVVVVVRQVRVVVVSCKGHGGGQDQVRGSQKGREGV